MPGDLTADSKESASGLHVKSRNITIRSKDPAQPATIRFAYDGKNPPRSILAGLSIDSESVTLDGLRFIVDGHGSDAEVAAIWLRGKSATLNRCAFIQLAGRRSASVVVGSVAGSKQISATLRGCYFVCAGAMMDAPGITLAEVGQGNQDAVVIAGNAKVDATDCAFGPHGSLLHFRSSGNARPVAKLTTCSAFLGDGSAAFQVDEGALCEVHADHCLFSPPSSVEKKNAALIRQAGPELVQYAGEDNRYYGVRFFLQKPSEAHNSLRGFPADDEDHRQKVGNSRSQPLEEGRSTRVTRLSRP